MRVRIRPAVQLALALSILTPWGPVVAAERSPPPADCPQPRFTEKAPADILRLTNPLSASAETLAAGQRFYRGKSGAISCATCHGERGDGKGKLAAQFVPPPRNFACTQTVNGIPDGQLFWIIKNGSPGTSMSPASALGNFTDENIWQVVAYLRVLAR